MMIKQTVALLLAIGSLAVCPSLVVGDFNKAVESIVKSHENNVKLPFQENDLGHDLHIDPFYYVDADADAGNMRSTLKLSYNNDKGPYKYVVGQRSAKENGPMMDRWDIRHNKRGVEYFAIYHGQESTFVANKLRAHLLRELGNSLEVQLEILDQLAKESQEEQEKHGQGLFEQTEEMIKLSLKNFDEKMRNQMSVNDDSKASATIVIVTESYLIAVNVGNGKVYSHNSCSWSEDLAAQVANLPENNLFGARKSRSLSLVVNVEIQPRNTPDNDGPDVCATNLLLLESPFMAKNQVYTINDMATKVAQASFTSEEFALRRLAQDAVVAADKITAVGKFIATSKSEIDFSMILIVLEKDFTKIH